MILFESEYNLGDIVFLKTDENQKKRIVKQICLSVKGLEYNLACGTESTWHSDFEITNEVDILVKTGTPE